jgi:ATP-dependent DNA helicase RecQ
LFAGNVQTLVLGFDRPNIKLSVAARGDGKSQLLDFVQRHKGRSGIIYCLSRKKTEETAAFLERSGVRALAYHAGMAKEARDANQNRFMTEAGMVMVATIAFGMGIDKPDVAYVFHTDMPGSLEAYYQEIGRAGRDGRAAEAHMLFGAGDIRMRRMFIDNEDAADEHKKRAHARLGTLIGYCEAAQCRRGILLNYFGEEAGPCGNCDNCLDTAPRADGTAQAQTILAAVMQSGERFGASYIVDILRGARIQKILERGHDGLAAFGAGVAHKKEEWQSLIRQMTAGGFLTPDEHGGLRIAESGEMLRRGELSFSYRVDAPSARQIFTTRKNNDDTAPEVGDPPLLVALKTVRLRLARERQVPAFVIFSDRTLIDMAARSPRDLDAFAQVHGVGATKLKDFGETFLSAIAAHA